MKRILTLILGLLACISLTACGEIATQDDMESYVKRTFGRAKCIEYNIISDEEAVATMQDKEYNFNYSIKSYKEDIYLDGTYFGSTESKESDFYNEYIGNMIKIKKSEFSELNCSIGWNTNYYGRANKLNNTDILANVYFSTNNEKERQETLNKLVKIIKRYDKRKALRETAILVYNDGERIGEYNLSKGEYMNNEGAMQEWFSEMAYNNMNIYLDVSIKSKNELEFMYLETISLDEIKEKYGDFRDARRITDTEESMNNIDVYHFKFKNDEYIIANCLDSDTNGNLLTRKVN